ncbi:MAG: hypothetical protein ACM30G_16390 [Micromonosporaceae bacterium]
MERRGHVRTFWRGATGGVNPTSAGAGLLTRLDLPGELYCGGVLVPPGYVNNPELSTVEEPV